MFFIVKSVFIISLVNYSYAFFCYHCDGGFETPCATALPLNIAIECLQDGATCFESIESFAYDSFRLVVRDCYVPNKTDANQDYCSNYSNPNGKLIMCRSCNSDGCNGDIYGSNGFTDDQQMNFTDFHYAGFEDADSKHLLEEEKYLDQLDG